MTVRTQPTLSSGISARVTEVMALSPSSFRKRYRSSYENPSSSASPASSPTLPIWKRYQGTSEPILYTKIEGDESEAEGTGSESEESEDEGLGSEGEEATSEDQQQQAVLVEVIAADEPLGLGYGAARRRALELVEGYAPSTFEIPASPKWSSVSLHVSPASLAVPSPVALLVTTRAASIALEEDEFLEAWEPGTSTGAGHYHFQCLMATNLGPRGLERTYRHPESGSMVG
ncbi:hypothetical protein Tco_1174633 [Tanacetum coccineum]